MSKAFRNAIVAGLVFSLFLYFLSAPTADLFHNIYLQTDWEWTYVVFQVLMGVGALLPWYGFGLISAVGGGLLIAIIWLVFALASLPFRRAAS